MFQISQTDVNSESSELETGQLVARATPNRSWWVRVTAGLSAVAVVLVLSAVAISPPRPSSASVDQDAMEDSNEVLEEYATVGSAQASWQIIAKERDLCSKTTENCATTKCCKVSGYRCYGIDSTKAKCRKFCKPGKHGTCATLSNDLVLVPGSSKPATSMYCFAVYTANTGSTKKSWEKELLTEQYKRKASIFACDAYHVYSDVAVSLGGDLTTTKVDDVDNDFHFAKRKVTGTWTNAGIFIQTWKAIAADKVWSGYDWVIKADADAVFIRSRLVNRIQMMPRTVSGVFLQNCKMVDYGFFGSLEVFSHQAFAILLANLDTCKATLPWKLGVDGGKHGPMGEDLFAEICMTKNGVDKVEAFDLTTDGACPADRPKDQKKNIKWHTNCAQTLSPAMHPFKNPTDYFKCLDETMALD